MCYGRVLASVEFKLALGLVLGWSEDLVIEAFNHDKIDACSKAGISVDDTSKFMGITLILYIVR